MYLTGLYAILLAVIVTSTNSALARGCAPLPTRLPQPSDLPIITTLPDPFTFRLSNRRVESYADWACRRTELKTLVQEYLYGYYPDHSLETVNTERIGNNLSVTVSVGDRSASFLANVTFPPKASFPLPVVIAAGTVLAPVNITPFLASGVAVAQFDVNSIANDSCTRIGAFWDLYPNRDIGACVRWMLVRVLKPGPGVMTAWAWAEHRILDAIQQVVPEVDATRVGVVGCSRYGKTALAAAIFDERVSQESELAYSNVMTSLKITLALPLSSGAEGIGPWRFYYESRKHSHHAMKLGTSY